MSGKIKKCCLLHEKKTWTRSRVLQNLNFGSLKHHKEGNLSNQKQPCCTSTIVQALCYFKRNRLPNVQDITFFSIRPPPNFHLINIFMSSLSPAAFIFSVFRSVEQGHSETDIRYPIITVANKYHGKSFKSILHN